MKRRDSIPPRADASSPAPLSRRALLRGAAGLGLIASLGALGPARRPRGDSVAREATGRPLWIGHF